MIIKNSLKFSFTLLSLFPCYSFADMTYGEKFLTTTLGSCAVGAGTAYSYASGSNFDSQPKQIVTFLGATTGCITGALFSYFFYEDKSSFLKSQIEAQRQTIQELSTQISRMQNTKEESFDLGSTSEYMNPFNMLSASEAIAKKQFDPENLPTGLNLRECNKLYQFTLNTDGNSVDIGQGSQEIVAVSRNFALVGFTFLYTPNNCFAPSKGNQYAGRYFPGLENYLYNRVKNWNATHSTDGKN